MLVGSTFANEVVTVPTGGPVVCGGGANVTCSGAPTSGQVSPRRIQQAVVTVNSPAFDLTGPGTLSVTPTSLTQAVNLGATGNTTGYDVPLGGSITLGSATPDGVYTGQWTVTADYQ